MGLLTGVGYKFQEMMEVYGLDSIELHVRRRWHKSCCTLYSDSKEILSYPVRGCQNFMMRRSAAIYLPLTFRMAPAASTWSVRIDKQHHAPSRQSLICLYKNPSRLSYRHSFEAVHWRIRWPFRWFFALRNNLHLDRVCCEQFSSTHCRGGCDAFAANIMFG